MKAIKITTLLGVMLLFSTSMFAQMETGKSTEPVYVSFPCLGEDLSGTVTYQYEYRIDEHTNRVFVHWSSDGGQLTGLTTGKVYRWNYQFLDNEQFWPIELSGGAWTATYHVHVIIIGTGQKAGRFSSIFFWTGTWTPDGELKVDNLRYADFCEVL